MRQVKFVKKAKFMKLLMAQGIQRNDARMIANDLEGVLWEFAPVAKFKREEAEWVADVWLRHGKRWLMEGLEA